MAGQAHFEIFLDGSEGWRWRLRSANGEIVASSTESYLDARDAKRGAGDLVGTAQQANHVKVEYIDKENTNA